MAKKVTKVLKLQIPGGAAVPGQQLGPVLGSAGLNIGEFVKRFNEDTKDRRGETVPVLQLQKRSERPPEPPVHT